MPHSDDAIAWPDLDAPDTWIDWANNWVTLRALNMVCTALDAQRGEFTIDNIPFPPNPNGSVNGGMLAAAADQTLGIIATLSSAAGSIPATATLHMWYHRPAMLPLTVRANVLPGGRRTKFVEVVFEDTTGKRCATAHGTMIAVGGQRPHVPKD
jgi:uncharacterized protein (TIGR00369 family)